MSSVKVAPEESNSPPNSDMDPPANKIKKLILEPTHIGSVSTLEEMDIKVIQFQQKKIRLRLVARQKIEDVMKIRIEQLETRQTQDDAVLNLINRHWNQLNEDIRILLQRFDAETSDELESENENQATTSFLNSLSTWDKDELDTKLVNRVQVSTRAVAKIIQAFDRLQQRSTKTSKSLKEETAEKSPNLEENLRSVYIKLQSENSRLQALNVGLHERHHTSSLKVKELTDKLIAEVTKGDELHNRVDDLSFEVQKLISTNERLITHIQDLREKYRRFQISSGSEEKKECDFKVEISDTEIVNLQKANEEIGKLVSDRDIELESLMQNHKEIALELDRLKQDLKQLPENQINETAEYKSLQSKFSVLHHEWNSIHKNFEEARAASLHLKTQQVKHQGNVEVEELVYVKKIRAEQVQLEDYLGQVRKEYEMLRIEFEQNLSVNEQTGPINREMRHLISSLQNQNQQLKGESQRYRRKYKEIGTEISQIKVDRDQMLARLKALKEKESLRRQAAGLSDDDDDSIGFTDETSSTVESASGIHDHDSSSDESIRNYDAVLKRTKCAESTMKPFDAKELCSKVPDSNAKSPRKEKESEDENTRDLKSQLKKAVNEMKEAKLLLDMYKDTSKEIHEKVELMASERKYQIEIDELKTVIKKYQDFKKEDKKKLADDDAVRRIHTLESQVNHLQKQVSAQKLEEDALIYEMDVTGQAFEDMQLQNSRLVQQLREKDDANFKLMSDRIKFNQAQRFQREAKDLLVDMINVYTTQLEAQTLIARKLEEKEKVVLTTINNMEKENGERLLLSEAFKRKAIENAQSSAELKLHLEKYHSQVIDAQQTVTEKTSALEAEAYKTKRLQEEIAVVKGKLEKLNSIDLAGNSDEVMMEEIREFKEILTCPSCKVKRKDAVLTKCFHVFCFDCLRTRYETRQRKCPKCNAAFGANDYHRLYLT